MIELTEHHHELVTPHARHGVRLPHTSAQATGHFDQQQVAHGVAMGVVERFEVVQVQEHERTKAPAALVGQQGLTEPVRQQAAVGQGGERVEKGQLVHLVFHLLARRDVGKQPDILARDALRIPHGADVEQLGVDLAIFALVP